MADSPALSMVVTDSANAAVIHVDGSTSNQFVITVSNQTNEEITIDKLTGPPSDENFNFELQLPNDKLYFYGAPTIDEQYSKPGEWELVTDSQSGWVKRIYLLNTATCILNPKGQTGDTLSLIINYSGAVPNDPKSLSILVQVNYQNVTDSSGTSISGSSQPQNMSLMANAGRPSPLVGSFVGPQTVLNNGTSPRDLTLRLVNTSLDPLQFIVPQPPETTTQSYIEVILPVSDQTQGDAAWTLCESAAWDLIEVAILNDAANDWTVSKSTTTVGSIQLEPNFEQIKAIPVGGVIELQLSGVKSGLEPGVVQVQVRLLQFALIGTQTFGVALEKSPLIYNNGLGSGMILDAGSLSDTPALKVSGDSSSALTHITQSGPGIGLQVDGGDVLVNNTLTATDANIIGGISANNVSSNTADISDNLTAAAATVSQSLSAGSFTANSANIQGNISANSASVATSLSADNITSNSANISGQLNAGDAAIAGAVTAGSATVNNQIAANSATVYNQLTAGSATINNDMTAGSVTINNGMHATNGWTLFGNAPDYSSTVSIGSPTSSGNTSLQVINHETTGYAVLIDAPNLSHDWWALAVTGKCINSSGSWYQFSDINLKEQITPFDDGLQQLLAINPISYNYKDEAGLGSGDKIGVSAQELQGVAPYMIGKTRIKPDSEDEYLAMDPGPLTYMLINAVKELHAEIKALKTKVEILEKS